MSDTSSSKPKKVYKTKGTLKQKKAIKIAVENGGNISRAMREAGYSPETASNPSKLTESKTWEELMEQHFPDSKISKVIDEGLQATRVISAVNTGKEASGATTDFVDVPDHAVRHKFAETALKLKNKFPAEKKEISGPEGKPVEINTRVIENIKGIYGNV